MDTHTHTHTRISQFFHSLPQKINEEQSLRQELQVKLLHSEQQLQQLRQAIGHHNGPGSEFVDTNAGDLSRKLGCCFALYLELRGFLLIL